MHLLWTHKDVERVLHPHRGKRHDGGLALHGQPHEVRIVLPQQLVLLALPLGHLPTAPGVKEHRLAGLQQVEAVSGGGLKGRKVLNIDAYSFSRTHIIFLNFLKVLKRCTLVAKRQTAR